MEGLNEKKWFVYLTDHHEGPFSLQEMQGKMASGIVTSENYVWAEGMGDWQPLTEIADFSTLTGSPLPPPLPTISSFPHDPEKTPPLGTTPALALTAFAIAPEPSGAANVPIVKNPHEAFKPVEQAFKELTSQTPASRKGESQLNARILLEPGFEAPQLDISQEMRSKLFAKREKTKFRIRISRRFLGWALGFILVGSGAVFVMQNGLSGMDSVWKNPEVHSVMQTMHTFAEPFLIKLVVKYPALEKYISPIPPIEGVSESDYRELKVAASSKSTGAKLMVALALVLDDLNAPTFYVGSNLPDGTQFDIWAEGVPDTLLNRIAFSGKVHAILNRRLGHTEILRYADGKALPRGEFNFYVVPSPNNSPEIKQALAGANPALLKAPAPLPADAFVLSTKTYFLGGKKDEVYITRLKEFHDKIRTRALTELTEVKQFSAFMTERLKISIAKWDELYRGKLTPAKKKAWAQFNEDWTRFSTQMAETSKKWTPESLENEYFYGSLYQLTQTAWQQLDGLHGLHNAYFTGKVDPQSFEIQVGEATSTARSAVIALEVKTQEAEKLPPTPSGMPRRDGL